MAITPVPTSTPLPIAPNAALRPNTFEPEVDAFLAAFQNFQTEQNAIAESSWLNAQESLLQAGLSAGSATSAAASASTAASLAGASAFVPGFSYTAWAAAIDRINGRTYRRKTAGSGTNDPSVDTPNWLPVIESEYTLSVVTGSVAAAIRNHYVMNGAATINLPALSSVPVGGKIILTNNSGILTNQVVPNGTDKLVGTTGAKEYNEPYGTSYITSAGTSVGWVI